MFLDVFPCFYKGKRGRGREREEISYDRERE